MDPKTLGQAISDVEKDLTALEAADVAKRNADDKAVAALAAKELTDAADRDAGTALNADLDALIAAATAAKVTR